MLYKSYAYPGTARTKSNVLASLVKVLLARKSLKEPWKKKKNNKLAHFMQSSKSLREPNVRNPVQRGLPSIRQWNKLFYLTFSSSRVVAFGFGISSPYKEFLAVLYLVGKRFCLCKTKWTDLVGTEKPSVQAAVFTKETEVGLQGQLLPQKQQLKEIHWLTSTVFIMETCLSMIQYESMLQIKKYPSSLSALIAVPHGMSSPSSSSKMNLVIVSL